MSHLVPVPPRPSKKWGLCPTNSGFVHAESQATAKHKWHRLIFDHNTRILPDFLEELNQGAENAFGENAKSMIDSLLYAKLPPKLKRSVNMARLENGTYEEIVAHLKRELELKHWRNRMTYQSPQWPQRPQVTAAYCPPALTPTKKHNATTARR